MSKEGVKYCPNCGEKIDAEAEFCPKCGSQILSLEEEESFLKEAWRHGSVQDKVQYDIRKKICFIATAAYGTRFSKGIGVLRRFRDDFLIHRGWGQALVRAYYTTSPPIAEVIGRSENLRKVVRSLLKPVVKFFETKVGAPKRGRDDAGR